MQVSGEYTQYQCHVFLAESRPLERYKTHRNVLLLRTVNNSSYLWISLLSRLGREKYLILAICVNQMYLFKLLLRSLNKLNKPDLVNYILDETEYIKARYSHGVNSNTWSPLLVTFKLLLSTEVTTGSKKPHCQGTVQFLSDN